MEEGTVGSWRTRSQVAPDWTVKDSLILVNEIAAVEADCSNALSSFQKWKIISENCNALDVHRTLNQCRRKWDALLSDYNQIKQWESRTRGSGSYWSLSIERKKKLKLPGIFDNELFEAIDAVVMVQEDKAGTEPDSDPEAQVETDTVDVIAELGPKKSRRCVTGAEKNPSHKIGKEGKTHTNRTQEKAQQQCAAEAKRQSKPVEEKLRESSTDEEDTTQEKAPQQCVAEVKSQSKPVEKKLRESSTDEEDTTQEKAQEQCAEEVKHQSKPVEEKLRESSMEEEDTVNMEEEAEVMAARLGEKADLVHAIIAGSLSENGEAGDGRNDLKTEFVRRQGDQLIACLREIVDTLKKFRELAQEFE